MNSPITFYNTLTRKHEVFKPIDDNMVTMYSCGPTVYSTPHIGNMRAYSFVDLLVRVLKANNYNVKNLINITDVGHLTSDADDGEDKLDKASKERNKNAFEIAEEYTAIFYRYLDMLNITPPTHFPKATDHIQEQIEMVLALEEKGFTYQTSDGVYFDTSKFEDYAKLSNLDVDGLREGERVDFGEKLNKTDFALWKFSPEGEKRDMEWNSPWGVGFPGWHIECSAMAMKHLGKHIDIHTGGIDHIPIHHTNEIAQTEAVTGEQFVNYWMHVNFLQLLKEDVNETVDDAELKMSKSKGTAYTLDQIVEKGIDPLALKFLYLSAHYRSELKFNFKILENTQHAFNKLQNKVYQMRKDFTGEIPNESLAPAKELIDILNHDLDTPKALAKFYEIMNSELSLQEKLNTVMVFDSLTGLDLLNYEPADFEVPEEIIMLAEERYNAKLEKQWDVADLLRNKVKELGFEIKDTKDGYEINKI